MRKFLPIILTFLAITAAFLLVVRFQPRVPYAVGTAPATKPDETSAGNKSDGVFVEPGKGVWVTQYDRDTGRRAYQFKADFYDNQPDGTVRVTRPVIEFFLSDGQVVQVQADDGVLRVAPGADRNVMNGVPVEPPRYGTMNNNVVVKVYGSEGDEQQDTPSVTMMTSHVEFDNDTFRLFTQDYVDTNGHTVAADDVPVTIRAKQYAFDGSGLVMYWDEMTRRLKSLDIAHGKQLIIYDSSGFAMAPSAAADGPMVEPMIEPSGVSPIALLAGDVEAAAAPAPRQRYLATFYKNVVIWQEKHPLVQAEQMQVDFLPRGSGAATDGAAPASPPAAPAAPVAPVAPVGPAASEPTAAVVPQSQPAAQPIVVTWDGKMHMVPTDETTAEPLAPGESIVTMTGSPVHLHRVSPEDGIQSDGVCAKLVYHTADASARLIGDEQTPMVVSQKRENGVVSTITGDSLLYSRVNQLAVIEGAGKAHLPDPNDQNAAIDASWDKNCIVHLTVVGNSTPQITSAELAGQVTVDHPRFNLTADDLGLVFGGPPGGGTSQQLKSVRATGNAQCVVHETNETARSLAAQELQLFTAEGDDGRLFPKTIQADGAARASQGTDNLNAEHIVISLVPKVAPAQKEIGQDQTVGQGDVQLDALNASDSVRIQSANGSSATGDSLKIAMVKDQAQVTLLGAPAMAKDKDSTLIAKVIHLSGSDQTSDVDGAGELDTLAGGQAQNPADARPLQAQPMKITWTQSATMDGKTNLIHVIGDVSAQSTTASGTVNTAHGSELIATLVSTPATQPTGPVVQGDFNFMRNKQLQSVSLRKKASLESTLRDAGGAVLRRYYIRSSQIDYDTIARKLSVPVPGQMLVEDHTRAPAQNGAQPGIGTGGRGRTAFEWSQELLYDEMSRSAELQGNVKIMHRDDGKNPNPMFLSADVVHAEFEPIDQSDDAAAQTADTPALQISNLSALHHVEVDTASGPLRCGEADYDPVKQLLVCHAGDEGAVTLVDSQGNVQASFKEVRIDLQNNTMEHK
jgi:hypothetical protein